MSSEKPKNVHAKVQWDEQGQPISDEFGDVYFSKDNGLAETRYVFLENNFLPKRWKNLPQDGDFIIGETGFGSGLNFLAAWELWDQTAPESARLHFVSVEKFPLNKDDLIRALNLWPELNSYAKQLIEQYPLFLDQGFYRLCFDNSRVQLTLMIDDAANGFSQLLASTHPLFASSGIKIDAWFLDGFSPSKNPDMWSDELFLRIQQLSSHKTTAATFSAAALVKQGLLKAGFALEKVKGFGRKRDMLRARLENNYSTPDANNYLYHGGFSPYPVPWNLNFSAQQDKNITHEKTVLIVGAGLSGCHTARALAERGWQVTVIERSAEIAQAGSGNPQGAVYAKLSPLNEHQAAFNLNCLIYALNFYRPLWKNIGEQCGLLQLAYDQPEIRLHDLLKEKFSESEGFVRFVSPSVASEIAGTQINHSAIYFPASGWINPRKLCEYLIDHPNIHIKTNQAVEKLTFNADHWIAINKNQTLAQACVAIICNAGDALELEQSNYLPLKKIRGQVTYFPQTELSPKLKTLVTAEGYLAPALNQQFCVGATFNLKDDCVDLRAQDHHTNLNSLRETLPEFSESLTQLNVNDLSGRVAFRASLPDYLPAVGPLPQIDPLLKDFAPLRKNARAGIVNPGTYWPRLYANLGQGSRGLAYTPLCAQLLCAQICNTPSPFPAQLATALHPARFLIRDLTRNKR